MDPQSIRHLQALRSFIRNLVEQAERSEGCECHRPPSLLLVGPPGAGKTFLVKQMSSVCEMPLFGVHTHQLSGPNSLRNLFNQARELDYPSLFFLDDIDFIFSNQEEEPGHSPLAESLRQELYRQLGTRKLKIFDSNSPRNPVQYSLDPSDANQENSLEEDDESNLPDNNGLILVAATSSPWLLYKDHELLSRFRGVYLVGLPDRETRFHLIKFLLHKVQHNLTEKEIWVVADKTEGFTPSDLMIVTKALNYKQFAFLFSMTGLRCYDGSSDDESITSSEETETDTESTSEQTEGSVEHLPAVPSQSIDLKNGKDSNSEVVSSSPKNSVNNIGETTIGNLTKSLLDSSPIKSMEKDELSISEVVESTASISDLISSAICNSMVGAIKLDAKSSAASHDENKKESFTSKINAITVVGDSSDEENPPLVPPKSSEEDNNEEIKEFELHIHHPPDPFPNDNEAVDSGSDSDNEAGNKFSNKTRRVNFSNIPSMQPLTVEVDHSDNLSPNNSLVFEPSAPLASELEDNLLTKDSYNCESTPNNILKQLLSSSAPVNCKINDNYSLNSKNNRNKTMSPYFNEDYHTRNYLEAYPEDDIGSCLLRERETEDVSQNLDEKAHNFRTFPNNSPTNVNNLSDDRHSIAGTSCLLTPLGSDSSITSVAGNGSENECDRRIDTPVIPTANEINKSQDSDSSYEKCETPTIPSSDVSTTTCNVSGETLECHSDSEERLRNLDEDLTTRRAPGSGSEDENDELSAEENETGTAMRTAAIRTALNLEDLSEVSIKIITIEDVLNVVSRTQRSVSDAEIKRYTDFMVWFANVAKSACPHNFKGAVSDTASSAADSVDSSLWGLPQSTKKRKGPLRKLGRFLLKALMFILD